MILNISSYTTDNAAQQSIAEAFRKLPGNAGIFWKESPETRKILYDKAQLKSGDRVLLLAEGNDLAGFPDDIRGIVGSKGHLESIDFRPIARQKGVWDIYDDLCGGYKDEEFDSVIAVSWHHMDNVAVQAKSLVRVGKKGRPVVVADHGPGRAFLQGAQMDCHLKHMATLFLAYLGSFGGKRNLQDGFESALAFCTRVTQEEIIAGFKPLLSDMGYYEHCGLCIVHGIKK